MSDAAKVALVTGGNRGIGLAIAKELAAQGVKVIIGHRSGSAPSGFESVLIDVSDTKSVDSAVSEIDAKYGGVDILVANAGITKDGLVMRMSDDDFDSPAAIPIPYPTHGPLTLSPIMPLLKTSKYLTPTMPSVLCLQGGTT